MMVGWGGKVRCNTCGGKVRCNSAAKNRPSARHYWRQNPYSASRRFFLLTENGFCLLCHVYSSVYHSLLFDMFFIILTRKKSCTHFISIYPQPLFYHIITIYLIIFLLIGCDRLLSDIWRKKSSLVIRYIYIHLKLSEDVY